MSSEMMTSFGLIDQPVKLGAGFDSLRHSVKVNDVVPVYSNGTPQPENFGQRVAYSLKAIESFSQFTSALNLSVGASFDGWFASGDARVDFVRELASESYYSYLAVRCVVSNTAVSLDQPLLVVNELTEFLGKPDASRHDAYRKWGDMFISSYVTGGEFIGIIEIQSKSASEQTQVNAALSLVTRRYQANADLKAAWASFNLQRKMSVYIYRNGATGAVPTTDQMIDQALDFPNAVNPAKGGKPVILSLTAQSYTSVLPVGVAGPDVGDAPRLLADYDACAETLGESSRYLEFAASNIELFPALKQSEVTQLRSNARQYRDRLQKDVEKLLSGVCAVLPAYDQELDDLIGKFAQSVPTLPAEMHMMAVGTDHNVGKWNGMAWDNQGNLGGWKLKMLTHDPGGKMWCVGTDSNVGIWNGSGFDNQGNMGGWTLKMLTFHPDGKMWCVGTDSNVGIWNGSGFDNQGNLGDWTLNMLTFDPAGTLWCVGTDCNMGKWNGRGWDNAGKPGRWDLKMLAFDPFGTMWCVGTDGNVGKWNGSSWDNRGNLGEWTLDWLCFRNN
jgi:hypothetical protein